MVSDHLIDLRVTTLCRGDSLTTALTTRPNDVDGPGRQCGQRADRSDEHEHGIPGHHGDHRCPTDSDRGADQRTSPDSSR